MLHTKFQLNTTGSSGEEVENMAAIVAILDIESARFVKLKVY